MKRATFSEFRNKAKDYFDLVTQGESIEIYRHGKPIARVVPLETDTRTPHWKKPVGVKIGRVSISKIILKEREKSA